MGKKEQVPARAAARDRRVSRYAQNSNTPKRDDEHVTSSDGQTGPGYAFVLGGRCGLLWHKPSQHQQISGLFCVSATGQAAQAASDVGELHSPW